METYRHYFSRLNTFCSDNGLKYQKVLNDSKPQAIVFKSNITKLALLLLVY